MHDAGDWSSDAGLAEAGDAPDGAVALLQIFLIFLVHVHGMNMDHESQRRKASAAPIMPIRESGVTFF
ncbi:hypothetical protein HZF08_00160 [Paenibacillus sp. CGMCC 1.16610]|uniref:Uncharacterized protein n=1 Tax=Paenibacillus anseongense TaxID=2682845 RepID=A0ABW9UKC8_9BACL|nr:MULTISPECIES: hypothetical protein [Paenibacillus]MBA2936716.1 hypothetical protein [Paenibacillus sp. CGMCC 1.16610]MVQ39710.1 hypothetical protein [Paenibacillus anseongense]